MSANEPETIDICPTWSASMEIIIAILESGDNVGKLIAREELRRVGALLDQRNGDGDGDGYA
jgi:hypothetical protein